jgi:Fe-S cluster biosynthesis and repair protein YggX
MIINEDQLNRVDSRSLKMVDKHMLGFLFREGEYGNTPDGLVAQ